MSFTIRLVKTWLTFWGGLVAILGALVGVLAGAHEIYKFVLLRFGADAAHATVVVWLLGVITLGAALVMELLKDA